jgi:hypothetical protein
MGDRTTAAQALSEKWLKRVRERRAINVPEHVERLEPARREKIRPVTYQSARW